MKKIDRRQFLSAAAYLTAAGLTNGGAVFNPENQRPKPVEKQDVTGRKLIVILFGGGVRSSETINDPAHCFIPHLWNEMIPAGTLFTNMRVEKKIVHPNSAGSIMTGHWEWDDIEWTVPVAHPTIFEIYRKARQMPDIATWAFVYASILAKTSESLTPGFGVRFAANVVEPPTIPRAIAEHLDRQMQQAASFGSIQAQIEGANICAKLVRTTSRISFSGLRSKQAQLFLDEEYTKWKAGAGSTSHDEFLADRAISCMHIFAPDVMAIDFGEIDCAHYGSWSRYVEAIRRTDELTWRLWQAAEHIEQYRGQTLLLILPDHGRELDYPGQWGFIHHSNFYTNEGADEGCRRVWMVALGPHVKACRQIEKPIPITTVAATGLEFLGLESSAGAQSSVLDLIM